MTPKSLLIGMGTRWITSSHLNLIIFKYRSMSNWYQYTHDKVEKWCDIWVILNSLTKSTPIDSSLYDKMLQLYFATQVPMMRRELS